LQNVVVLSKNKLIDPKNSNWLYFLETWSIVYSLKEGKQELWFPVSDLRACMMKTMGGKSQKH